MRILLSNDDGYLAPGLRTLYEALKESEEITVVAPDRDHSGASNSLTLQRPLSVRKSADGFHYVDGTPTDCVHLAITGLMEKEPDMVIAGINSGSNLGDDVIYSGTVAAATEGRFLGLPAMAISITSHEPQFYETAARVVLDLLNRLRTHTLPADTILNINVPDIPYEDLQGIQATRLGKRHKSEPVIRQQSPHGQDIYWVGPSGQEQDAGPGTDFHAIKNHYASVTPLEIDLTRYKALEKVSQWLDGTL
ncbi:MAG: 5'/3'-nucleotidase SurE [Gammaproteobacteria bacterium]|nr:5'/3'-nucleotidase SurE [Gammaproteobacteria bacterium]MDX2488447.1 5'/3'-nucleotidase SurE [Gammaproteobacteria bacterium]